MSNPDSPPPTIPCFRVHGAAEAATLPRVIGLFAKRALVPERVQCRRTGAALAIEIETAGVAPDNAAHNVRCLGALVAVERVAVASRPVVSSAAAA